MENKPNKIGLLQNNLNRKSGNFEPREYYKDDTTTTDSSNKKIKTKEGKKKEENFINQNSSIKISKGTKDELDALKFLKNSKYDYEIIQTLIDHYVNTLSSSEYKKYKLILDLSN